MTPDRWLVLLGIAVALLGICVPVLVTVILHIKGQHRAELKAKDAVIEKKTETIEQLKESNLNYRFALAQLGQTAEANNRLLSSLPIPQSGSGS